MPTKSLKTASLACVIILIGAISGQVRASSPSATPLAIAIAPPVQFPSSEYAVTGLRLSALWGNHRSVYGFDFGLLGNVTEQTFVGIGLSGAFNITRGQTTALGLQAAGLINYNKASFSVYGAQLALGMNYNEAASKVVGVQVALANVAAFTNVYGAQIGVFNHALDVYGLQIGVVNVASSLHGVQIGLLNFNQKGLFYVAPILNVGF